MQSSNEITNNLQSCKKMIEYCVYLENNGQKFELMSQLNMLSKSLRQVNFKNASEQQHQQRTNLVTKIDNMKNDLLLRCKKKESIGSPYKNYEGVVQ